MNPVYFLSISTSCWSALFLMVGSGSVPMAIRYGTHCDWKEEGKVTSSAAETVTVNYFLYFLDGEKQNKKL